MTLPTIETAPQHHGYGASLNGLLVRLAAAPNRPVVTEMAQLQPSRFSTEANPEDVMPAFGDVHSQSDWSGGEGLFNRFRRQGSDTDPIRFWSSEGIDVSPTDEGTPEELRLLPSTERIEPLSGLARMARAGRKVWVTAGTLLRRTDDVLAASPTFVDDGPHAGEAATAAEDVATLGDVPYAALGANGIHRNSGGWAHWSDVAAVRVWSVLDRIIASDGARLYEAAAGAGSVLLYTLPPGDTWTDVADASGAIVASATNGFVYVFRLDNTAALQVIGQSRMKGEQPVALAARGDLVFVATADGDSARLWMAEGPGLEGLQLLREWSNASVGRMVASRDRVHIGATQDGQAWEWRLELSTLGLSKALRLAQGPVDGIDAVEGKVVASVGSDGVWRQAATLVDSGWLIGPMSDFFRAEEKSWVTGWADVRIRQGEQVALYYTTDRGAMDDPHHHAWRRLRTHTADSEGVEVGLGGVVARSLAAMVRLERPGADTSPRVRSVSFRSYPGPGDVIVELPVDVGDQIERPGRRRVRVNGWGAGKVLPALRELEGRAVLCRVFRTGDVVRGLVEKVATPVPAITPRGSATVISMVTVRGRRVSDAVDMVGAGWGGFAWGDAPWGGGEA